MPPGVLLAAIDDRGLGGGNLSVHVLQLDGSAVLAVRGELDLCTSPELWSATAEVVAQLPPDTDLVLDARRLEFLDAAGLGVLVRLDNALRAAGSSLRVQEPPPPVRKVFEITELDHLLSPSASDRSLELDSSRETAPH